MALVPRDYQEEAVKAVIDGMRHGESRQLLILPTGSGKTISFALLLKKLLKKGDTALILAHREELLTQAKDKIALVAPELSVGLLQGERRDGLETQVCVASVQTAATAATLKLLEVAHFKVCIVDECHHAMADTYLRICRRLGFISDAEVKGAKVRKVRTHNRSASVRRGDTNGIPSKEPADRLLLGVTATASRLDGRDLGIVFPYLAYEKDLVEMIEAGYLCNLRQFTETTGVSLKGVKTRGGDFAVSELARRINVDERNFQIVEFYRKHAEGRKGVVFCVDVEHSKSVAKCFCTCGIEAAAVYGSMPKPERSRILDDYRAGKLSVITNCQLLTEGWDVPEIQVVMTARPTQSNVLFSQMVGRGMRPAPNKNECILLDFADISLSRMPCNVDMFLEDIEFHGASPSWEDGTDLLQAREKAISEMREMKAAEERLFERKRMMAQRRKEKKEEFTEELRTAQRGERVAIWWNDEGDVLWTSLRDERIEVVRDSKGFYKGVRCDARTNAVLEKLTEPQPEAQKSFVIGACEDWIRRERADCSRLYDKDAKWRGRPASEAQLKFIRDLGGTAPEDCSRGQASTLIESLKRKRSATPGSGTSKEVNQTSTGTWRDDEATPKQVQFMRDLGIAVPPKCTKGAAKDLIDIALADRTQVCTAV